MVHDEFANRPPRVACFDMITPAKSLERGACLLLTCLLLASPLAGCREAKQKTSGPLPQIGYIWQRDWNPAVVSAAREADRHMDGMVVLGAEILKSRQATNIIR